MVNRIERAFTGKKTAVVVFLDNKGAFDNLSSEVIAHGMQKHGVNDDITDWMLGYLNYRFCKVKGSKQSFKLIRGTGQGGILSPMIWNFVMDSFLEVFTAHATEATAYADDGAVIVIADSIPQSQQIMQTTLDKAQSWSETVGL
jgi:retron-type reverse transcriptase